MNNKTVEAIKNGQEVAIEDLFELVNAYELTNLSIEDSSKKTTSIMVNKYEKCNGTYEFSQECSFDNSGYGIGYDSIISSVSSYSQEADALYITCKLVDGGKMQFMILMASESFKTVALEPDFREADVYELKDFLKNKENQTCMMVKIRDVFGISMKVNTPANLYIAENENGDMKLHIGGLETSIDIPVIDDCCNLIYEKVNEGITEFLIKPYGQPFTEIRMIFFNKESEEKENV